MNTVGYSVISVDVMPLFVASAVITLVMAGTAKSMESNAMNAHRHMKWLKNATRPNRKAGSRDANGRMYNGGCTLSYGSKGV